MIIDEQLPRSIVILSVYMCCSTICVCVTDAIRYARLWHFALFVSKIKANWLWSELSGVPGHKTFFLVCDNNKKIWKTRVTCMLRHQFRRRKWYFGIILTKTTQCHARTVNSECLRAFSLHFLIVFSNVSSVVIAVCLRHSFPHFRPPPLLFFFFF